MKIVLLGAPGAGKGIQSGIIEKHFNVPSISSGNLIRKYISSKSENSDLNKSMLSGKLLSDEFIMNLVLKELGKPRYSKGYVLDGVPRTITQADMVIEHGMSIDTVIYFNVSDEIAIKRILQRKVCIKCGTIYSGNEKNTCAQCGGELSKRSDDNKETLKERLISYHKQTEPLIDYYTLKGILKTIDGNKKIEDVSKEIFTILESL